MSRWRTLALGLVTLTVLAAADDCPGLFGKPKPAKACGTQVVDGPRVHLGLAYAMTRSECDARPRSHVVNVALWRKSGSEFIPVQINKGDHTKIWFETCGGIPYPGHPIDCSVQAECVSGIWEVRVTITGISSDGVKIDDGDGDGDWDMPERPRAELRCPKRG